jgi:hypothetical protein
MRRSSLALIGLLSAGIATAQQPAAPAPKPDPNTRVFPAHKCRYTLPGKDWFWVEQTASPVLFRAENFMGYAVALSAAPVPPHITLNQQFAEKLEKEFFGSSDMKKRGGRFVVFNGLSCYQSEAVAPDGRTAVCRIFLANGFGYNLEVVGTKDPVELSPNFEKIMNGFGFTEALAQPGAAQGQTSEASHVLVVGLGFCAVAAFLMRLARGFGRKTPRRNWRRLQDDIPGNGDPWKGPAGEVQEVLPAATSSSAVQTGVRTSRPLEAPRFAPPINTTRPPENLERTGRCRHCGFRPLAFGVEECPNCCGRNPNPGVISRYTNRGTVIGIVAGAAVGVTWGYLAKGVAGVIGGILLGPLAGIFLGIFGGLLAGITARVMGKR